MLRARYVAEQGELEVEEPVDMPDGTDALLYVVSVPSAGHPGLPSVTRVRAVYRQGRFLLRRRLQVPTSSAVTITSLVPLRPLIHFQAVLGHLKEDGVALQHKAGSR